MLSPVSLSNRYPVTDSLQIFKGYPASGVFSLFNNPLADDVVNVICHSTFFAPPFFEQPFGRFSSFALEFLSQFGVALTEVIQVIASISVAIRISGNIFYAKVNADKFINILRFWRFNLTSRKKVKRAVNISQVRLAALIPQQFKLAFAAGKLYPLAALSSPDRHFLFIDVPAQDTGIVSDSAVGLKDTLSFLVQFVSVGYFRNATHDHLSGKAKLYYNLKASNGYTQEQIERKRLSLEGVLVPVTAKWNEELLRMAGFVHVDSFWRWMNFAGWVAVK